MKNLKFQFFLLILLIATIICSQLKKIPENPNKKISKKPVFTIEEECDLITEGPITIDSDRILLPSPLIEGLLFYYSFDLNLPLDQSGRNNHPIGKVKPGFCLGGNGNSALFDEGNFLQVDTNNNNDFSFNDFTVTFWFYLLDFNEIEDKCPIFYKGNDKESTISIEINDKDKNYIINIDNKEIIESRSKIVSKRWTHISLIKSDIELSLYINGILDTKKTLNSEILNLIKNQIYIGNVPWLKEKCILEFMIDEIRLYKKSLSEDYIQAEASPSLGGIEPNFISIGCLNCSLEEANSKCNEGYKLCTSLELHTGGYHIAKSLGLINSETYIWTHNSLDDENKNPYKKGLGLCCKIIN